MIAYSSWCCKYIDDILELALSNPCRAVEWDMNFIPPTLDDMRIEYIKKYISKHQIQIRYHLPYSYVEIAHFNCDIQNYSISVLKQYLKFIHKLGGHYAVLHVGYNQNSNVSVALKNLKEIASYAQQLDICICIENLISGLTIDSNFIVKALSINNVYLCLDTGHADIAGKVNSNYLTTLSGLLYKCKHSHVYLTEVNYNHIAIQSINDIKSIRLLDDLMEYCTWYTMELETLQDQKKQEKLMKQIIDRSNTICPL